MPNDAATSSGCTPDSIASTARSRIASRVWWSSLRPSLSRTRHCRRKRRSSQLTYVLLGSSWCWLRAEKQPRRGVDGGSVGAADLKDEHLACRPGREAVLRGGFEEYRF